MNTLRMRPVKRAEIGSTVSGKTPRGYDFAAAGIALAMAVVELVRIIGARRIEAADDSAAMFLSGSVFCVVLAATAIGMALHRQMGWMLAVLGFIWAAGHGVLLRTAGNMLGVLYVFGAVALGVLVTKSLHWYRSEVIATA